VNIREETETMAARIREELARRRLSRSALAASARISLSTLEKALSGRRPFTLATLVRLEEALGLSLRAGEPAAKTHAKPSGNGSAPDELGSYARAAVAWLEGSYLTLRPSVSDRGALYAYRTDIAWDDASSTLTFREAERLDREFTQFGSVAVPHQSGHIYLATNRHGQHRLAIVARPTISGDMHGILTTLQAGKGSHLSPISMPIVLSPMKSHPTAQFGQIRGGHAAHFAYTALLRRTTADQFATFLTG
jgi:transcriptional regulator with XRE-family HTH domain